MTTTLNAQDILNAQQPDESHAVIGVEDTNLPPPISAANAIGTPAAAPNFPDIHSDNGSQNSTGVGESNLPQPINGSSASLETAAAPNFPDAQVVVENQIRDGVGDQAGTETAHPNPVSQRIPGGLGPILADPTLAMCAEVVEDLERVKIANQNRLRALTDPALFGLTLAHPDVARLAALVEALESSEHQAVLNLQRVMRKHPLGPWVKAHNGIGEKQAARLLAAIRDPYWNDLHDRPRSLRELYRYCGMDVVGASAQQCLESQASHGAGVAPSKQRGERITWNPDARMRVWLIADKCVMITSSPYRVVYDEGRIKYATAVHAEECRRCGPKGKPAQPGSPLSAGHQHARARRLIAKAILRDLWAEAKAIHERTGDQS